MRYSPIIAGLLLIHAALACGQETPRVVLLRGGQVLQGVVSQQLDQFQVATESGGQIRLPAANVELVTDSPDDVYLHLRDRLTLNANARLWLANWCIQQGLPHRAADQLLALEPQVPEHPQLASTRARLHAAFRNLRHVAAPAIAASDGAAAMAQVAPSLSPQAVERFTVEVQPLLLNRCATAACHGISAATEFKLLRPQAGQLLSQRHTQRNLQATLAWLEPERPSASRLLLAASSPHATGVQPLAGDDPNFTRLADWVKQSCEQSQSHQPAGAHAPAAVETGSPASDETPGNASTVDPFDPFDPAPFNQRYHQP